MQAAWETISLPPLCLGGPLYHLTHALLGWQLATTAPWLGHTSMPIGSSNHLLQLTQTLWGSRATKPPDSKPEG